MKYIKPLLSILSLILASSLLFSCGMIDKASQDKTIALINPEVDTSTGKVIIFPMMLLQAGDFSAANTKFDSTALNALLVKSWSKELEDGSKYIVPKTVIEKLPKGWEAVEVMVRGMDSANMETRLDSDLMQTFYQGVNNLAGKGVIAVSLVFEDEETYKTTKKLHYNAGLFDIETAKFKWITKTEQTQSIAALPYQVVLQKAINNSWEVLKEKNNGQVR